MSDLTSLSTLFTTLACVALNPGLRSVLIFDAPSTGLQQIATLLEPLLGAVSEHPVHRYQFDANMSDDDIWGSLWLPGQGSKGKPLLFSPQRNASELQLITIADLAQLNLSASRTCLMLIGADVASLERNGEHQQWHPDQCWLASCESDAIGRVSPHLLDRFALRLSWQKLMAPAEIDPFARSEWLRTHVPRFPATQEIMLPGEYVRLVQEAQQHQPMISPEVLAYVTNYLSLEHYTPRRELALARFAYSLSCIDTTSSLSVVTEEHVDTAALVLGLIPDSPVQEKQQGRSDTEQKVHPDTTTQSITPPSPSPLLELPAQQRTALIPEDTALNPLDMEQLCDDPYPEDTAPIEREAASLKFPLTRFSPSRSAHGPIVGVEESETLHDLALFSTMLAAAKFQVARGRKPGEPLRFELIDLRRYRRSFVSSYQLLLVLDYTSVRDITSWRETLLPYLHEAYIKRAGISIVKIGAQDATSPLCAELVTERGFLVPRVGQTLLQERGRGYPTPLAHGLYLALAHIRRLLQHGHATATHVTLLVVSDGRGNVPLEWSLHATAGTQIVTREGIDDALAIAQQISEMQRVEALLFYPQSDQHSELPRLLAQALGADIIALPLDDELVEVQA